MDKDMRRIIEFSCEGVTLIGTLDEGNAANGLLIVSGGNEIRIGAHRGMAVLAQDLAATGYPIFRFDRRGIGDSEGVNGGFEKSGPDICAALVAFRMACPEIKRIVAFGNCDAATALILHTINVDHLVLANPWVIEPVDDLPPAAAIKDRYSRRLRDPSAWFALITGKLNLRNALRGLSRISASSVQAESLINRMAKAFAASNKPTTIVLASGDNTAIAFADAWKNPKYEKVRKRSDVTVIHLDSSSHSFASENDYAALVDTITAALIH